MRHWLGDVASTHEMRWYREVGTRVAGTALGRARSSLAALDRALQEPARRATSIQLLAGVIACTFLVGTLAGYARFHREQQAPRFAAAAATSDAGRLEVRAPREAPAPPAEPAGEDAPSSEGEGDDDSPTVLGAVAVAGPDPAGPAPNLLPTGKGMWFHHLSQAGEPAAAVEYARSAGLTHLYVRTGSSKTGFYAQRDLDVVLPLAHAAGIKVVGWDFPYLDDPVADARRALDAIRYTTPDGHRIDAFSADIETSSEGVKLAADRVDLYGRTLRELAGPGYPLVGTVPNACLNRGFPYAEVAAHFDAFAPMVYWITRDPAADVACNMEKLGWFGLPVLPIGQAYDPAIDNPTLVGLVPRYEDLEAFMSSAAASGAAGVSFWAWHTATPEMWQAVIDSVDFDLVVMEPGHADRVQVSVLQRLLRAYGFDLPVDGRFDGATSAALAALQATLGLEPTGSVDADTIALLG